MKVIFNLLLLWVGNVMSIEIKFMKLGDLNPSFFLTYVLELINLMELVVKALFICY